MQSRCAALRCATLRCECKAVWHRAGAPAHNSSQSAARQRRRRTCGARTRLRRQRPRGPPRQTHATRRCRWQRPGTAPEGGRDGRERKSSGDMFRGRPCPAPPRRSLPRLRSNNNNNKMPCHPARRIAECSSSPAPAPCPPPTFAPGLTWMLSTPASTAAASLDRKGFHTRYSIFSPPSCDRAGREGGGESEGRRGGGDAGVLLGAAGPGQAARNGVASGRQSTGMHAAPLATPRMCSC